MGATYTRQSTYVDGDTIQASDTNDEFDQLLAAFASSTGHTHDGTTAEGGPVTKLLGTAITIGDASSGTDIAVTFDGETNDGVLTWMDDEDYFKFCDDVLIVDDEKLYFGTGQDAYLEYDEDGNDTLVFGLPTAGGQILDDKYLYFGTNLDVGVGYDENGDDSLEFLANVEGAGLVFTYKADQGDDNADIWKQTFADAGTITWQNKTSGSFVTKLTLDTGGNVTVAGDLTVSGDDITMGTNTDTAIMVADGTNFNPVVPSGDIGLTNAGVFSIASGVIVNADVNSSAAIADSKLATISTADKVSAAAVQVDGATDGTSITIADTDKFIIDDAGTTKYVNASQLNSYIASEANAADDISTGDAASSFQTSSGNVTIDSQAGTTTVDGHTGVTVQSTNSGDILLDSVADVVLDAAGNDITLKAAGTTFGSLTNSSGELLIKSGSTPTTAITFAGANATAAGNVTVSGNLTVTGSLISADVTALAVALG